MGSPFTPMMKSLACGLAALALGLTAAEAAVVPAGAVTVDYEVGGTARATASGSVQLGTDVVLFETILFDVNGGADADLFTATAQIAGGCGFNCSGRRIALIFTLPEAASETPIGFELLSSAFDDTVVSVAGNVSTISFEDGPFARGTILSGRFLFDDAAPVPVPAAALLFAPAAAGLAFRRRRAARG